MSRMAVWKERLGGTGFGSADQPEHWAWTDRSKMADGLRCAEFKGAGQGGAGQGGAGQGGAGQKTAAVRKILAREALTRKAQTFAQTFAREQVSEYGRRP